MGYFGPQYHGVRVLVGLVVIWARELQAFAVPLVGSCRKPRNSFSVTAGRGYG